MAKLIYSMLTSLDGYSDDSARRWSFCGTPSAADRCEGEEGTAALCN